MGDEYTKTLSHLCELFPEMEKDVVETVLNQNGNLPDPTVSALLNMNDPTFKPDQQDLTRQQEVQRDAEYARRLYQREVAANNYRQRQFQRQPSQRRQPGFQQQQQQRQQAGPQSYGLSTSTKSSQSPRPDGSQHTKTSTKIRNIFRLGSSSSNSNKRSASNTPPQTDPHRSSNHPHHSRQQYGADDSLNANTTANRHTLDSDFDSSSDSELNRASRTPELPTADHHPEPLMPPVGDTQGAGIKRNPSDVFGHLDTANDLSSAYVPLSPSRIAALAPTATATVTATTVTAFSGDAANAPVLPPRIATTSQQPSIEPLASAATVDIDLEHPFDSNPLLIQNNKDEQPISTNPFEQPAVQDTNPFRSRKNTL
ncbi:hypothetical protein LPJ64_005602 [Coemansia asiatica]|uniref:CUE domain-containing protein n=1 Tax=Coemansia asiatica TaxID=1052880 RepID=A0A9W7XG55_9FUNG|nr:hypothetical protein LPJ64_005602 [Coemansia asiatica]KAJ2888454.1 hypothetical protein FB639_000629 [Coemansia asiatica]